MARMGQGQVVHRYVRPTCHGQRIFALTSENRRLLSEHKIEANVVTGGTLSL